MFAKFIRDESGATAIEYGLIAAIIGIGIVASLNTLQTKLTGLFSDVGAIGAAGCTDVRLGSEADVRVSILIEECSVP